jgi:hypothetical protein
MILSCRVALRPHRYCWTVIRAFATARNSSVYVDAVPNVESNKRYIQTSFARSSGAGGQNVNSKHVSHVDGFLVCELLLFRGGDQG